MNKLEYPFDSEYILKKSKSIRRELSADGTKRTHKKIAVLGGSTTHDYIRVLELFLLNYGIEPEFYESEYDQYYQDAMFDPKELVSFEPDLIYIHTGYRNIENLPVPGMSREESDNCLNAEFDRFKVMWKHLADTYHCPVIQNNFEYPFYRVMGNYEATDPSGRVRYVNRLNEMFAEYASVTEAFYIHDINYLSASYGLDKWIDPAFWHMYKYMCSMQAIPEFAYSLSHIMKAIWGKNKKALVLDLDNTLWGGIVGDDGPEGLEIGMETSVGQTYTEFQTYLKEQKKIGVLLNIDSKNDEENAMAGLEHPAGVLKKEDFIEIRANWDPKDRNLIDIASAINILPDSMVFVDDNPAERMIVADQVPGVNVPDIGQPEEYIRNIDKNGYFEVIGLSEDDKKRNDMYKANAERSHLQAAYTDYREYLLGLKMKARIAPFEQLYYNRISQLTNKSNQFNLTTLRCTVADIEKYSLSDEYITLYGQLEDKFGDNGIVSLLMGRIDNEASALHMELWLMSCRVLKRDMECAMKDAIVKAARAKGLSRIYGYYYPTAKNGMVKEFYMTMGFEPVSEEKAVRLLPPDAAQGSSVWVLEISGDYENDNNVIEVEEGF
ncbi:MAG: HAD-IIIC family phosphatase [Lachnospiraceae bacterium]|nr:HAD-IIIC family phosphatase [Lachnospiraceae bacterium]